MFTKSTLLFCSLISTALLAEAEDPSTMPYNFVELRTVDSSIEYDIRMASSHNFIGHPLTGYKSPVCLLSYYAAIALKQAQANFKRMGYSIKIYDCYRPQRAVDEIIRWSLKKGKDPLKLEYYPRIKKTDIFVKGFLNIKSSHSRGSAVDLTIVPLSATKQEYKSGDKAKSCIGPAEQRTPDESIDMGTGYSCYDDLSAPDNKTIGKIQQENRKKLSDVMVVNGFLINELEWWHFTYKNEAFPNTFFDFEIK